jgi:hypothetical protein
LFDLCCHIESGAYGTGWWDGSESLRFFRTAHLQPSSQLGVCGRFS